jgi:hypothetical protein
VALAVGAALLGAGCTVEAPDLAGKHCPCAPDWTCDQPTNVCVRVSGGVGGGAGAGAIVPTSLRAVWTTPESIRWEWDAIGPDDAFLRYELITALDEADLGDPPGPSARVWTPDDNPELAAFRLPHTGGADQVVATTTDGHQPFTQYVARLTAIDTQQRSAVSNVASGRTTIAPIAARELFVDDVPAGAYLTPDAAELSAEGAYAGSGCIRFVASCGDELGGCFEQIGPTRDVDVSAMSLGDFTSTAYVEFFAAHDSAASSFWSQVRLQVGTGASLRYYLFPALTVRTGEYRRYQVPLRALGVDELLEHADLADGVGQLTVGGTWDDGAVVRIDEARLRW